MKNHGYRSRYGAAFYSVERRAERRKDASERNRDWESLSPTEQLAELDKRLGKGIGAKKQRAKIKAMMDKVK